MMFPEKQSGEHYGQPPEAEGVGWRKGREQNI